MTGEKSSIDRILKALDVYVARAEDHAPILLVGNDRAKAWRREYALAPAGDLVEQVLKHDALAPPVAVPDTSSTEEVAPSDRAAIVAAAPVNEPALKWFTDMKVVDHEGRTQRLYSDLIRGKTVVVSCFFSTCTGICPPMNSNLLEIQTAFRDRMGEDLYFVSITVDPETDTPERLGTFAEGLKAAPGWSFVTGTKEQVGNALYKFGLYTDVKENHKGLFLIGNDRTGLWEKAMGLGQADDLIAIVDRVLHDEEDPSDAGPTMPPVRRLP